MTLYRDEEKKFGNYKFGDAVESKTHCDLRILGLLRNNVSQIREQDINQVGDSGKFDLNFIPPVFTKSSLQVSNSVTDAKMVSTEKSFASTEPSLIKSLQPNKSL